MLLGNTSVSLGNTSVLPSNTSHRHPSSLTSHRSHSICPLTSGWFFMYMSDMRCWLSAPYPNWQLHTSHLPHSTWESSIQGLAHVPLANSLCPGTNRSELNTGKSRTGIVLLQLYVDGATAAIKEQPSADFLNTYHDLPSCSEGAEVLG